MKPLQLTRIVFLSALLFLVATPSSTLASKPATKTSCKEKIAEKGTNGAEQLPTFLKACGAFAKREKRVPTQQDLAQELKLRLGEVRAFFADRSTPHSPKELFEQARQTHTELFSQLRATLIKKAAKYIKDNLRVPTKAILAELGETTPSSLEAIYGPVGEDFLKEIAEKGGSSIETLKNKIVQAYANVARIKGRVPHVEEVAEQMGKGLSAEALTEVMGELQLFESWDVVKELAMQSKPGSFKNFTDTDFFNPQRLEALKSAIRDRSRLIFVTAIAGSPVDRSFLDALSNYAERNDAEVIVLPANMQTTGLDPILLETPGVHVLTHELLVNPWLTVSRIKVIAKQVNPAMGIKRLKKRGKMVIIGSPKMHVDPAATINNALAPHRVVSPGAITQSDYNSEHYQGLRTDYLADADHVLGALIVEKSYGHEFTDLKTAGFFHARHVEFIPEQQGFMDLGTFYTANKTRRVKPEALVLGDIHVGDTDEKLMASIRHQLLTLKPKYVVLHDLLNGYSISPHEKDNIVKLSDKAAHGDLNLRAELDRVVNFIDSLMAVDPQLKIVVVPSNHDYWLHRWLKEARYAKEPQNAEIGAQLFLAFHRGVDPFKAALLDKEKGVQNAKRLIFLDIGTSFTRGYQDSSDPEKSRLVELALHGHEGANGAKLSIRSMQEATDRGVYGHTHTYARKNGIVNVGTITGLDLSYNRGGFSNWIQAAAIIGPHGEIQALEFKEGEWFADPHSKTPRPNRFFFPDYPRELPNPGPVHEGHIDQWSRKR